ncbi:MAG: hypothetical protein WDO74_04570 [Pseudomonadota bacterium]
MPTRPRNRVLRDGLTSAQAELLTRYRRGLVRLAGVLAVKLGVNPTDVIFLLAHERSKVGVVVQGQLGGRVLPGSLAVVVPGLVQELPTWIERLALSGPVYDCTRSEQGVAVLVFDEHNEMTLVRLTHLSAASFDAQNREVIPSE